MHSIEHVEEVLSRWTFVFRKFFGEELHELLVVFESREQGLDGDFVVLGHVDLLDLRFLQQMLLTGEHITQEVLVNCLLLRKVELHYKKTIRNENVNQGPPQNDHICC